MSDSPDPQLSRVLYLPHGGGPLPLLGDPQHASMSEFLHQIPADLGRPDAVLMVSAHWETAEPALTAAARPELIYDYSGFPPESYRIRYPAAGSPALAERVAALLGEAGIRATLDPARGFDHGMFVPMKLMYPRAELPCVQLSLVRGLDPAAHIRLGRALGALRQEKVLILGSGMSFHNLRAFFGGQADASERSRAFNRWLIETCTDPGLTRAERESRLIDWSAAPQAGFCHPRAEHLLPLHLCFGAASRTPAARVVYDDRIMGMQVCALMW